MRENLFYFKKPISQIGKAINKATFLFSVLLIIDRRVWGCFEVIQPQSIVPKQANCVDDIFQSCCKDILCKQTYFIQGYICTAVDHSIRYHVRYRGIKLIQAISHTKNPFVHQTVMLRPP